MKFNRSTPLNTVKALSQELLEMIDEFLIDLYKELINSVRPYRFGSSKRLLKARRVVRPAKHAWRIDIV